MHNTCVLPLKTRSPLFVGWLLMLLWNLLPVTAWALESVSLQLKWDHAFQFAGYYAAVENGYYRDVGLDVQLREAIPGVDPLQAVLSGEADYGVGTSSLLLARKAGQPVVVLAVIFQHSPLVLIARRAPGDSLQSIHDMVDKRIMIEPQSDELLAYFKREGIPPDRLTLLAHSHRHEDLIEGRVDAMSAYESFEPFFLNASGFAYHSYSPRSAGIDFYGDNLFTTEEEIRRQPQRVEAFRQASLRGWAYAMAHPQEMVDLIVREYSHEDRRALHQFEAERMQALLRTDLIEVGYMHSGRWRHIADTYADVGLLPHNYPLDGFLYITDVQPDLTRLYISLALLTLISGIALYIHRINRRLGLALAERSRSEARHRVIFQTTASAGVVWREDFVVTDWNRQAEAIFGWKREEVLGRRFTDFLVPDVDMRRLEPELARMTDSLLLPHSINRNLTSDGRTITCEWFNAWLPERPGEPREVVSLAQDISERLRLEENIRQLAFYDPLTHLPNRRLLDERLKHGLARARRDGHLGALMVLDLDNFKPLNDAHGHEMGDRLLEEVARRLKAGVRDSDTVARFGGDEFVVLLETLSADHKLAYGQAEHVAQKLLHQLSEPYHLMATGGLAVEHHCSASIGLTIFDGALDAEDVFRSADNAMYRAKHQGRHQLVVDRESLCSLAGANTTRQREQESRGG